ncbi:fibulin-1-like [Orbicella faveolata]|uniref:fibulin-1-like n=1 Tax=Orbicella faveolata TaxID=48498 RepID=UPI0009E1C319|nr:fibulin-1-like [Orbicella faveolata]
MARASKILLLLVISLACISIVQATYLSWVVRCCSKGRLKAKKSADPTSCNSDDLSRRRFQTPRDRLICRHAERICCVKEMQKLSCQSGKYEATLGQPCDTFRPFVGGDNFRECCDCCSLGIKAKADPYASCSTAKFPELMSNNFSFPCVQAFRECCSGKVKIPTVIPTIKSRKPQCSDNFCDQECQDSPTEGAQCSCRDGYRLQPDRVSCKDIDECQAGGKNVCSPLERCINTAGSYKCDNQTAAACKLGEQELGGRCIDIDECARGQHGCGSQQTCVNNDGSYSCACRRGYEASGRSCVDKDECETKEASCPANSSCVNTAGSYRCECERGLQLRNNKCEDIDECSTGQHSCRRGTQCENTVGYYKCTRITCPSGQELGADGTCKPKIQSICDRIQCGDGFVCNRNSPGRPCQDINECSLSPPKCKANEVCFNFIGTFECRDPCKDVDCGSGLKCEPAERSYSCKDIDECRITPRKCTGDHEICVNSYGSYSCRCRAQFRRNRQTQKCERIDPCTFKPCPVGYRCEVVDQKNADCKEINECLESPPRCRADESCQNYPGGYYCTCQDGYRRSIITNRCEEIDECNERRSGCSQICQNTPGSFVCRCRKGFEMMPNKRTCRDIDECTKGISGCSQVCENTLGSFVCRCRRGYELSSDGRTCNDRNECDSVKCAYRCLNTGGSFRCICPSGYNSSGYYCSDFDECKAGAQCKDNEFCFNTYGSYRCIAKMTCPSDYEQVSDTRCDRSCKDGDLACFSRKVRRYSLWTFKLRSNDPPSTIFSYRIVTYGYRTTPNITFYFHRGNEEGYFEIDTKGESNGVIAYIKSKKRIEGPKIFLLEFRGDVTDFETGDLASRFVHRMFVFVSRYDF